MKRILSYKDFHSQEVFETNTIEDNEQSPEGEILKITEITADGIVVVNNEDETSIVVTEEADQ